MAETKPQKKNLKVVLIAAAVVLLLLVGITGTEMWLAGKARQLLMDQATGLRVEVGTVDVSLINRAVRLRNVEVRSDSAALLLGDSTLRSLHATLQELSATGIGMKNREGVRSIRLRNLRLMAPSVVVDRDKPARADAPADSTAGPRGLTTRLKVGQVELTDGAFQYNLYDGGEADTYTVVGIQFFGKNFDSDSLANGTLRGQEIQLGVARIGYSYNEHSMLMEVDTVAVNADAGSLTVAAARMTPQYAKEDFALLAPESPDWTQVSMEAMNASGLDFETLLKEKTLVMDSLRLGHVVMESYKNRKIYQKERVKPLFSQTMQRLPVQVAVGKAYIDALDATYEELAVDGLKPGVVTGDGIAIAFDGLTNIPSAEKPFYTMTANGKLMNEAPVDLTIHFPIDSLTNRFDIAGHMGAFNLTTLNKAFTPLMKVDIESGRLTGLDFHIGGTMTHSEVELTMLYNDLSLSLLKPDEGHYAEREVLSFFLDTFLVKDRNPDRHGKVRTGAGSLERNLHRSQYNYLWKSLLPGIKKTVL